MLTFIAVLIALLVGVFIGMGIAIAGFRKGLRYVGLDFDELVDLIEKARESEKEKNSNS